jgi:hypothetical protein
MGVCAVASAGQPAAQSPRGGIVTAQTRVVEKLKLVHRVGLRAPCTHRQSIYRSYYMYLFYLMWQTNYRPPCHV